jgi:hypothetical protein
MKYQYKVVPFIGQNRGSLSAAGVAAQLEMVISQHVEQGWEFYQLADVNIEVQPGCISGLFGAKVQYIRFDQLIFRASLKSENSSRHPARGLGSRFNVKERDASELQQGPGAGPREPAAITITPKHLEVWQRKSDEELRKASDNLQDYTEEGRRIIIAELARRSIEVTEVGEDADQATPYAYCYHCGADVQVGSKMCTACGKSL